MKKLLALFLLVLSLSAYSQAPDHTRLLYSHDLRSANDNGIGQIDNLGGTFTAGGWKTSNSSQLRILFRDFLPQEGTVEFKMTGLNAANVPADFDWAAASLWSRGETNFDDLNLSPASFFMLKMDNKLFTDFNRSFKMFVSPFGVESGGKNGNLESYYPVGIMDWNNPGMEYTVRIIWGRPANATDETARLWFQVVETGDSKSLAFEGQIESFAYLCLGRDDTYNQSVPNVIYKDLKVYGPDSDTPFTNVAFSTNTRSEKNIGSQGAAVADMDGNGNEDIYVSFFYNTDRDSDNLLFVEQNNQTFEEEGAARNVNNPRWSYGSMIADFDLDGDLDIFSGNYNSQNKLYYNNGSGLFSDVTNSKGISSDADDTKGVAIIDLENDGDTDIIVVNAVTEHKVYLNDGSGSFTFARSGIEGYNGSKSAKFQSASVGDLNGDGFQDVILSRQYGPSLMFINNGSGKFSEQSAQRGFSISKSLNSANLGDIDNDGDLDIICGITTDANAAEPKNDVFCNDGSGNFNNIASTANITLNAFGTVLGDWDNDGDLDVFAPRRHGRFSRVYLNDGSGSFSHQDKTGAEIRSADGRGVTSFDFNNDGFLDIYAASRGGEQNYSRGVMPFSRNYLLRNDAVNTQGNNHYLKVAIYNDSNSPGGLGTKIWAYSSGGMDQANSLIAYREVSATSGFQSQRSYIQHLGLGTHSSIDLKIQLPNGTVKEFAGIGVDQRLDIFPIQVIPDKMVIENGDQPGKAGAPLAQKIRVRALSADDQPAASISIDFQVLLGNGHLDGDLTSITKLTDGSGYAEVAWTLGRTAGAENQLEILALYNNQPLAGSPYICSIVPAANDPAILVKDSGDGQSQFAGRLLPQPLVVKVEDLYGNAISGFGVDFAVTRGDGTLSNGSSSQQIMTDGEGKARINWTLGPTIGSQNMQAAAAYNGNPLQNSPLEFTATANEIQNQMLYQSGNGQTAVVGQPLSSPFVVKVQNNLAEPVSGVEVKFIVIQGGGSFGGADTLSQITNAQGLASALATLGRVAGDTNNVFHTVTTEANGSPVVFRASARPGPAAKLTKISGDRQQGAAGRPLPQPLVVSVFDPYDNAIPGFDVDYSITGGGTINGATSGSLKTDASGRIAASHTLRTSAGSDTIRFVANGLAGSPATFIEQAILGDPFKLDKISGNGQRGVVNSPLPSPFKVIVTDKNGHSVPDQEVEFVAITPGAHFGGNARVTVMTDSSGVAAAKATLGAIFGDNVFAASSRFNDVLLEGAPLQFTASGRKSLATHIFALDDTTSTAFAGSVLRNALQVVVRDGEGTPVAGHPVHFERKSGNSLLNGDATSLDVQSNDQGIAAATVELYPQPETTAFSVSSDDGVEKLNGSPIQFEIVATVGPPDPAASKVTAMTPVIADGRSVAAVDVVLKDKAGNAISGKTVTLFTSGLDVTVQQPATPTDLSGKTSGALLSTHVGPVNVWAVADGVNLSPDTVQFVPGPPAQIIPYGDNQFAEKGTQLPDPVGMIVQDSWSHFVTGAQVTFSVIKGGGSVSAATVLTNEGGRAEVLWTLGMQREQQLSALVTGMAEPIIYNAVALPPSGARLRIVSGDSLIGLVNQPLERPFVVQLVDTSGNPLANEAIRFDVIEGEGRFVTSQKQTTNQEGKAQAVFKPGTGTGLYKIRASAEEIPDTMVDFKLMVLAEPTVFLSKQSQDGQTFRPFESTSVALLAADAFGRPLPGLEIGWLSASGGVNIPTDNAILTDDTGLAKATATIGSAGPQQLNLFAKAVKSDTVQFIFTSQNSAPVILSPAVNSDTTIVAPSDTLLSFFLAAADGDHDPILFGVQNMPEGALFDSTGSLLFNWRPSAPQEGEYTVTFFARDNYGGVDSLRVHFVIGDGNQPPQFISRFPTEQIIAPKLNQAILFTVEYRDPEGASLSYKWFVNDAIYPAASNADSIIIIFDASHQPAVGVRVEISDGVNTERQAWGVDLISQVELSEFSAAPVSGGIQIRWHVVSETDNTGYVLLRAESESGPYKVISPEKIAVQRSGQYSFLDQDVTVGQIYFYKLVDVAANGRRWEHGPVSAVSSHPQRMALAQNYPNPFNPTTIISFELTEPQEVTLILYNTSGQVVKTLVDGYCKAGYHRVEWNATNETQRRLPSGIYYYQLRTREQVLTRKLILLK